MSQHKGETDFGDIEEMSTIFDFLEGEQPFMEDLCPLSYQDGEAQPRSDGAAAKRVSGSQKRRLTESSELYNCSSLPNACLPVLPPQPPSQPAFLPPPPPPPSSTLLSSRSSSHMMSSSSSSRSSSSRDHPLDRKKHRERMRRMEVNDGFNQLLQALDEVDCDPANKAANASMNKGEFRVDILSRAAKTLRKLHREVEECRVELEKLKMPSSSGSVPMQAPTTALAMAPVPAVAPSASPSLVDSSNSSHTTTSSTAGTSSNNNKNSSVNQQPPPQQQQAQAAQQQQQPTLPMTWVTVPMWLPASMDGSSTNTPGGPSKAPQALAPAPAPMMLMPSSFFQSMGATGFSGFGTPIPPSSTTTSTNPNPNSSTSGQASEPTPPPPNNPVSSTASTSSSTTTSTSE